MAKKVIATLKSKSSKDFVKVIRMVRSPKTGGMAFKEDIIPNTELEEFLAKNKDK